MEYLRGRVKNYIFMVIGLLIGFLLVSLIFQNPDYKFSISTLLIVFIIAELMHFKKWRKDNKEEVNF